MLICFVLLLGICTELVLSFSIITNFKAICDRTVGSDTIPSIHGLRAISMAWVILGRKPLYIESWKRTILTTSLLFRLNRTHLHHRI